MSNRPPNIVLILADDLGGRDLGCDGSAFYETPNLDRLAAQSLRFTDAYAACPVCSPSRASLLTGRYPASVGITDWIDWGGALHPCRGRCVDAPYRKTLPPGMPTIATGLRESGYATWHIGKWHLGGGAGHLPEDHGFEVNIGGCEAGSPGRGGYFSPWSLPPLAQADVPEGTDLTDYLTDRAIECIRGRDARPFFLNLWHYTVHTPLEAKQALVDKYAAKARRLGLDRIEPFAEGEPFPTLHKRNRRVTRRQLQSDPVYAAMIETLDQNIGRLLQALEEEVEAERTLVMFTSDNGGLATSEGSPTCNAPLSEGKGWTAEGGLRVPLIARWPGVTASGGVCAEPVTSPDLFATLAEAADLNPGDVDGVSLLPLLRGETSLSREAIYWHYPHYGNQGGRPGSAIRVGDYKLIEHFEDARLCLYHLRDDIAEQHDLSATHPAIVADLHRRLSDWRRRVDARLPEINPEWNE